ncbi:MAG: ribose 5-phosphate isomerase B [Deltaproteobacteria bacterium RIFCSPLOWO2_12_FULL_43_16]|nr:MAG: ribose 5-phosphate isomerase B [Deltaproteobacteria bacterium GWA2_43_19]OGQ11404.1 MAG: ribose 5-phosphate isomerase B [Deltaproteobacteria bacterium RIFCSPHIGHO2_02_FULL_43_33]OGQ37176.1 MAG: ribose 5-phosphate isomerase B [Deltaproteobacteria bacterium RIFCSPLOWO2_01_FULL_42_9]OGQ60416.1 MAG: ribose 5-phosphate isomerase B [Deltaproteobacteria bacterium RIFCSPLOWO2_12_FULL_43_16]HBR17667.1 ribose 5-phosphate isomerase B [Deltaproteobacteria bacterium]
MQKIAIASDHGGIELKEDIKIFLKEKGFDVLDMGTNGNESVDYPDYGVPLSEKVSQGKLEKGILICGTGIGMSIVANKFSNVRAALVSDVYSARMAKEHNDANILVIGGRVAGKGLAREMVKTWLEAKFQGGRHQKRLDKIKEIEKGMKR